MLVLDDRESNDELTEEERQKLIEEKRKQKEEKKKAKEEKKKAKEEAKMKAKEEAEREAEENQKEETVEEKQEEKNEETNLADRYSDDELTEEEKRKLIEEKRRKKEEKKKAKEEKKKAKEEAKMKAKEEAEERRKEESVEETKENNEEHNKKEEVVVKKVKVKKEKVKGNKFRNIMLVLIFLVLTSAGVFGLLYLISPYKLELNGEKEIEVSYGSIYEEQGATVKRFLFVSNKKIEVDGEVDTSKPGTYTLTYTSDSLSVTRTVKVVDNEAPELLFDEDEPFIVNVNGDIKVLEVEASDKFDEKIDDIEIDGDFDITKLGEYKLKYKACDSSLNCATKTRKVIVKDIEAPVITLNKGDLTLTVNEDKYEEYGATAKDNYDKDLGEIKIEGKVDVAKIGEYEVKYSLCDSSENCSEVVRKVSVKKKEIINGKFESVPEINGTAPSELSLNAESKTATVSFNYCEGMVTTNASYSVSGNTITLKLEYPWDNSDQLTYTIIDNDTLRLDTDIMACAPRQYETYKRK